MTSASLRGRFPVTAEYAYFNHAAIAPLPRRSAEAMRTHLRAVMRHGVHGYGRAVEEHEGLRRATATMLHCDAS